MGSNCGCNIADYSSVGKSESRLGFTPIAVSYVAIAFSIVFIYFSTQLKYHVENYFYDLTTRIRPVLEQVEDLAVVPLDDQLSFNYYEKLISALDQLDEHAEVERIIVYFWENFYPFDHSLVNEFIARVKRDPRIYVGVLGFDRPTASSLELPPIFQPIADRVFGMDTMKDRSNSVVRTIPFTGYRGDVRSLLLATKLASPDASPVSFAESPAVMEIYDYTSQSGWYLLNYRQQSQFLQIPLEALLERSPVLPKAVVLTPLEFREWVRQTREQTFVNTPYAGDRNTYRLGQSLGYVYTVAINNTLHGTWLKPTPRGLTLLLTSLFAFLFGIIWRKGTTVAVLVIVSSWVSLILVHGLLSGVFNFYLPLADIFILSSLAMIGGALWQMNREIRNRAQIEAETRSRVEVAQIQSRFLDTFSFQMLGINEQLSNRLTDVDRDKMAPPSLKLLEKTIEACIDFSNFLSGIKQVAALDREGSRRLQKSRVPIEPMITSVVRQFDSRIQELGLEVMIECEPNLSPKTDPNLVEPIIFNLVSNAVKYSPPGGRVTIRCQSKGGQTIVEVEDEGPGIPKEHRENIFEKFYRIKDDSVYKVSGTGLGLYLCKYFSSRIGAKIDLLDSTKKGSVFRLTL